MATSPTTSSRTRAAFTDARAWRALPRVRARGATLYNRPADIRGEAKQIRRNFLCVPKGRPISTVSKPHLRWCASRSTGNRRCVGSTSSTRGSRIPRCGTIRSRRRRSRRNRSVSKPRSTPCARSKARWPTRWSSSRWARPRAMPMSSARASILSRDLPIARIATRCRRSCRARPMATIPICRSMPVRVAPKARTGPTCCCACMHAGPNAAATRSKRSNMPQATRLASRAPPF